MTRWARTRDDLVTTAYLRPLAEADLISRTRYYCAKAGDHLAERFFDAAIAAIRHIEQMPGRGSPHLAQLCDIPGLRVHRITGFPCGWYYLVTDEHIDVVRLLADAQDIPAALIATE